MYLLYYVHQFKDLGIKELWIKYGSGDSSGYIPIHKLADITGSNICKFVLKAHLLSGYDVTNKVGTKAAALKSTHVHHLISFRETCEVTRESFVSAESYLEQLVRKSSISATFNELR